MAKQSKTINKSVNRNIEWEGKLSPVYRTLVNGFNGDLTVKEFVAFLGHETEIPEDIAHIKLRNFTPQICNHPKLKEFWQTAVSLEELKEKHPSIALALADKDFQDVQKNATGYEVDLKNITYETLFRLISTQEVAYYQRLSQLVRDNLMERLEKLSQPEFYNKLRECAFVKKYKLENCLPKNPPSFEVMKNEFNVKSVERSVSKSYEIKEIKDKEIPGEGLSETEIAELKEELVLEKFLVGHETYGTTRVRDMLRTSIDIPRDNVLKDDKYQHYMDVRNVLYIALKSGELGMVCNEFVDSVNYPPTNKTKDLYPTGNAKGEFFHAGLNGTLIAVPMEIQLPYMRDDLIKASHDNMKESRSYNPNDPWEAMLQQEKELERREIYDASLHEELIEKREAFLVELQKVAQTETLKTLAEAKIVNFVSQVQNDLIGSLIVKEEFNRDKDISYNVADITGEKSVSERRAAAVALAEFPEEAAAARKNARNKKDSKINDTVTRLEPNDTIMFRQTMDVIVKKYDPKVVQMYPSASSQFAYKQ